MRNEISYLDEVLRDSCDTLERLIRTRARLGDPIYHRDTHIARIVPTGKPIIFIAKEE